MFHDALYCMLSFKKHICSPTPEQVHNMIENYFTALDHTKPPLLYHSHVQVQLKAG